MTDEFASDNLPVVTVGKTMKAFLANEERHPVNPEQAADNFLAIAETKKRRDRLRPR